MQIKFSNNETYTLTRPPLFSRDYVQVYYDEYSEPNLSGFQLLNSLGDVFKDYSNYIYQYNVVTSLDKGVCYTYSPDVYETSDNLIKDIPYSSNESESSVDIQSSSNESNYIVELYELLKGYNTNTDTIANAYAELVNNGKDIDTVPEELRDQVKDILGI